MARFVFKVLVERLLGNDTLKFMAIKPFSTATWLKDDYFNGPETVHVVWQPAALENLAIDKIAEWIVLQGLQAIPRYVEVFERDAAEAEDFLSRTIEIIRSHLRCNLHSKFYNNLAKNLLEKKIRDDRYRTALQEIEPGCECKYKAFDRLVETVFSEHLTRLDLDNKFLESFPAKAHLLPGLTDITLKSFRYGTKIDDDVIKFLKELHCLKSLRLCYISDSSSISNVIKCVAENCKLVESLSLSFMRDVDHKSVDMIIRLQNLKRVDLFSTAVNKRDVENLLLSCEHIEEISLSTDGDTDLLASALQRIASHRKNKSKRFNLKFYENSHLTTRSQLELIVKMCPLIQKINLVRYFHSQLSFVRVLMNLQDLREIHINEFRFYADGVMDLLDKKGHQLTQVELACVTGMDMNALICISNSSPNLQKLCLWGCEFDQKPTKKPLKLLRNPPFGCLKSIRMSKSNDPNRDLTDEHKEFLLAGCPNVELMDIERLRCIREHIWLSILDKNPLKNLKHVTLNGFDISKLVLFRILGNCIYHPEVLMQVERSYHGIDWDDIKRWQDLLTERFSN